MKKIHLVPNLITAFGFSCGLFVVFSTAILPEITEDFLKMSAAVLLIACFADLLDGAVARAIKAESEFGGLFDSLSDAVTFGIGPPLIVLKGLEMAPENEEAFFLLAAAMVFSACGILRLVRFGVAASQLRGEEKGSPALEEHKRFFTGLPIPVAAACCLSFNYLALTFVSLSPVLKAWLLGAQLVFLGYCMVCRLKFPSFKLLRFKLVSFQQIFFHGLLAVFVLWGFRYHFGATFFMLSWGYLFLSLFLSMARYFAGKRLETLKDFDPDPEEDLD